MGTFGGSAKRFHLRRSGSECVLYPRMGLTERILARREAPPAGAMRLHRDRPAKRAWAKILRPGGVARRVRQVGLSSGQG